MRIAALIVVIVLSVTLVVDLGLRFFGNRVTGKMAVIPQVTVATSSPLPASFLGALTDRGPYEPLNILIIGSDTRAGQGSGFGFEGKISGARSDTTMLVHLNAARTDVTVVSWPRDLYVTLPECVNENGKIYSSWSSKFNAAFSEGGANCTISTILALSGIEVHHVIIVDFKGFQAIVDQIGGLPVCLPEAVNDDKAHVVLPAGQQTLTGKDALGLARARKSLADGSDLRRIDRQQALAVHALEFMRSSGFFSDPKKMYSIAQTVAASLSVDAGLSNLYGLAALAWQSRHITPGHVHFVTVPYHADKEGPNAFLEDPLTQEIFQAVLTDQIPASAKVKLADPVSMSGAPTASSDPKTKPTSTPVCANPLW